MRKIYLQLGMLAMIIVGSAAMYLSNVRNEYKPLLEMNLEAMANANDFFGCQEGGPNDPDNDGILDNGGYHVYGFCDGVVIVKCRASCGQCNTPYEATSPGFSSDVRGNAYADILYLYLPDRKLTQII